MWIPCWKSATTKSTSRMISVSKYLIRRESHSNTVIKNYRKKMFRYRQLWIPLGNDFYTWNHFVISIKYPKIIWNKCRISTNQRCKLAHWNLFRAVSIACPSDSKLLCSLASSSQRRHILLIIPRIVNAHLFLSCANHSYLQQTV